MNGAFISAAKERGYEVDPEQLQEITEQDKEMLTEEELSKVSGGYVLVFSVTLIGSGIISYLVSARLDP